MGEPFTYGKTNVQTFYIRDVAMPNYQFNITIQGYGKTMEKNMIKCKACGNDDHSRFKVRWQCFEYNPIEVNGQANFMLASHDEYDDPTVVCTRCWAIGIYETGLYFNEATESIEEWHV